MAARDLLHQMLAAGFTLGQAGDKLLVTPADKLTDELRVSLRACKPELLALLAGDDDDRRPVGVAQRCTDCRHLSKVKTCTNPVAAGLLDSFGIVWPEPGYGATCQAWRRNPAEAVAAVYTAAGRGGWPDKLMHQWLRDADEHPGAALDVMTNGGPTP